MSYSFNVTAASKEEAKAKVLQKFDDMVAMQNQEIHKRDREAVLANVTAVVDILGDDPTKNISVSVNGYLSWQGRQELDVVPITSAAISCSAGLVQRI